MEIHVWLTVPNLFTMIRVAMTPFILMALARGEFLAGGWLFGGAALTDLLDGAVARRFGSETKLGTYLDPIADKILLSSLFVGLGVGHAVPWWFVAAIFGRDLWILLLSAIALRFTTFRQLEPSVWGKACTFLQVMTAIALMAGYGYNDRVLLRVCQGLIWLVVMFVGISAGEYTFRGISWLRREPGGTVGVGR